MAKCAECGFLAILNEETGELQETQWLIRQDGVLASPLCFMRVYDLWAESNTPRGNYDFTSRTSSLIVATLQKERECNQFVKWQQGFSPKEHREMIDREKQDKLEAEIRASNKRWHIAEIIMIIILTGLFTLLGAFIGRGG
jgi:hypothetical protein